MNWRALETQGEAGVRALALLRDVHRMLSGERLVRLAEVAAACVRSAADALLGLAGARLGARRDWKPAAKDLLAEVGTHDAAEGARGQHRPCRLRGFTDVDGTVVGLLRQPRRRTQIRRPARPTGLRVRGVTRE